MNPPFCPNPACEHHHDDPGQYDGYWQPFGYYTTLVVGIVKRFKCRVCNRGFSERTFDLNYYTKRNIDFAEVERAISQSESVSTIARNLKASPASILNRIDRIGRVGIAMHADLLPTITLKEDLTADGFESFDRSQFHPNQINLLLGKESQFLLSFTHVTIRRKGRMTPGQKRMRAFKEQSWRAPRGGIRSSFGRLLRTIDPLWDRSKLNQLVLWTDEHQAYPKALGDVAPLASAMSAGSFVHKTWPSTAPRTMLNPLFSANYYDRELRKDLAALRRESTCFTRNVSNGLMRFVCHMVYHNYMKPHRIEWPQKDHTVHAEVAGVAPERIKGQLAGLFTRRPFLSHHALSEELERIWLKRAPTPHKTKPDYLPRYALAV